METSNIKQVKEGKAEILYKTSRDVFYNPVQEFNRDLSVSVLKLFNYNWMKKVEEKKGKQKSEENLRKDSIVDEHQGSDLEDVLIQTRIERKALEPGKIYEDGVALLEALAASGLRSIRYAKEAGGFRSIIANDLSRAAVESMKTNIEYNEVSHLISTSENDATALMYQRRRRADRFNAIDLDPYGSPTPFLDAAIQSISDGGLLLVTATDMAVLCGNSQETCFYKYGSLPLRTKACHEMALRILLQHVQSFATRYGRYIRPILSVSVDFYIRIFVQVFSGNRECKRTASETAMGFLCTGCETQSFQYLNTVSIENNNEKFGRTTGPPVSSSCKHCGSSHHIGGPFYMGPLHDQSFLRDLLNNIKTDPEPLGTVKRLEGVLTMAMEELSDVPFYYLLDQMSSKVKVTMPTAKQFRSAICNAGYRVSMSHCAQNSIKTDAPPSFLWDIFRELAKDIRNKIPNNVADAILSKPMEHTIDFTENKLAIPESQLKKLVRFQENPERNWGPKHRAKISLQASEEEKRIRNQGKKKRKMTNDSDATVVDDSENMKD
ncbi:tRNA (guanine(26)-N(2))-dimethyltransferase-like isoform X3 [Artemia franciscana]|nr:hypothetical protein QYM36_011903 [Artemia franciscana]